MKLSKLHFAPQDTITSWIFANTFYCGYVTSALLPGELIKGKHPALIDVNTFLQVNNICQQNTRIGVPKKLNVDKLPLKVFMRHANTGSPFTGYHNKEKNLFYYKSRDKGTKVSTSAKSLNKNFEEILQSFEFNNEYKENLKCILHEKLEKHFVNNQADEKINKRRVSEVEGLLNYLEERLVINEITNQQFDKFSKKYYEEIAKLKEKHNYNQKLGILVDSNARIILLYQRKLLRPCLKCTRLIFQLVTLS